MAEVEALAEVRYASAAELPTAVAGADVLFMWDFLSSALVDAWPAARQLQWIHQAAAGVDKVLLPEVVASDVVVTNSRNVFDQAIAEYVLGLVLSFAKDFPRTLELQREHTWQHRDSEMIAGKQAVVVGVGPIGRATARLLRAAGLRVRGVGRTARTGDEDFGDVLASSDLLQVLPGADYVVVAAPLTPATRGMFDAAAFDAMQPTARFVNIGRGEIVVQDEMVEALVTERIAGAALDVFEEEPLPADSPLWEMPNVVVSPHMSADFIGWLDVLADVFVDNFTRWHAGQSLRNVVDKQLGYVAS
ncbi:MAG: D-2-hydroxyacid dehydrogenase [Streptosporangiales bacterium]|nr:D-2-hydroxyacid dehydrogenase [Streptosporangiales bacterium]